MPKIIYALLLLLTITLAAPAKADVASGVDYLKTQTQDEWVTMALVAAGETDISTASLKTFSGSLATDYAKRILAVVAVGENPTTFTGLDLMAGLQAMATDGQLGSADLLNDDAWGILALRSAGLAKNSQIITDSANFLLDHQQLDGGWSWSASGTSDTNDTAAVIMALIEAGYPAAGQAITDAVAYLKSTQKSDGGWAYEPIWDSDAASTAWVITALTKISQTVSIWSTDQGNPAEFLLSLQTDNGSFKWVASDTAGSASITAFSIIALANASFPVKMFYPKPSGGGAASRPRQVDLIVSSSTTTLEGAVGDELVYTVTVANQGPDAANDVEVNNLAGDLNASVVSVGTGSYNADTRIWYLDSLSVSQIQQATIKLVLPLSADFNWDITTSSAGEDVDLSNNRISLALKVAELIEPTPENSQVLGATISTCDLPDVAGEANLLFIGYPLKPTEGGEVWYYDPVSLKRYCLPDAKSAYRALEVFGLGITNENLARIPTAVEGDKELSDADKKLVDRLKGRILLQVESLGEAWYVDPRDGTRHYLPNGETALNTLTMLSQVVPGRQIFPISVGEF
ncbi:MAG: prenyltransferase/squalene oxidase repeat-containing protein [Patescibacteria group bacterium]